jgi:hypothetical protein
MRVELDAIPAQNRGMTVLAILRHTVPDGVIRSADLRAAGMSNYAVSARTRPSGPWQLVLPGVILMRTGPPTRRQRLRAALAYCGPGSVITGVDALHELACPAGVHILIPAGRRVGCRSYLTVERTTRMPAHVLLRGLPVVPVTRAAVDAARHEHNHARLRALLMTAVRAGRCTWPQLRAELDAGNQRGTAGPRAVLSTVVDEVGWDESGKASLPSLLTSIRRGALPQCLGRVYGHMWGTTSAGRACHSRRPRRVPRPVNLCRAGVRTGRSARRDHQPQVVTLPRTRK